MMIARSLIGRKTFEVPCTVEIEHTAASLHAHVDLDGAIDIRPGDEVRVLGERVEVPFGEKRVLRRRAAVTLASPLEGLWTRLCARFELTELYEVSFTPRRKL